MDRISPCRVVMTVNAVPSPRLLDLGNCLGTLEISDLGVAWTARLLKLEAIKPENLEYVGYRRISRQPGCYSVTITYDATPNGENTAYKDKMGRFCIVAQ